MTGTKKSQALLSSPFAAKTGAANSPRKFVVVASAAKKSWIPAVKGGPEFLDPEWLDGS